MGNIKITRRVFSNPIGSMSLWLIPLINYVLIKSITEKNVDREWIIWILLPSLFIIWFFINFKIEKRNGI
jgi:hypothetical protein